MRARVSLPTLHFLGHSTVRVELAGVRVLTDPVLLPRVSVLRRVSAPIDPVTHSDVDVVVISHLHADHLDLPSLRLLGAGVPLMVPAGAADFLGRRGFTNLVELAPGEAHRIGRLQITATRAVHDGARRPFGPRAVAVGYLLEGGGQRVYFAGDTDLFDEMSELGEYGLDAALIPVWGWGPNLGPGHLDPTRAATATGLLRPRAAVPIHWGTLRPYGISRWMREHLVDPPHRYARATRELGLDTPVLLTEPGQPVVSR